MIKYKEAINIIHKVSLKLSSEKITAGECAVPGVIALISLFKNKMMEPKAVENKAKTILEKTVSKIYKECDGYSFGILVVGVQVREALYCNIYVP